MSRKLSCSVLNCTSSNEKKTVIYFRYPLENKELLKKWLQQIKRPNWHPAKGDVICSGHFNITDIHNPQNKNVASLKAAAVPSIFPQRRKQMQIKSSDVLIIPVKSSKSSAVVVSKAKSTGMTVIKPQIISELTKNTPGRKKKLLEKDLNNGIIENKEKKSFSVKRPVLRICVNKKYKFAKNGATRANKDEGEEEKEECDFETSQGVKIVDHIEAATVIFKLDPETNEIVVLKKGTVDSCNSENEGSLEKQPRIDESESQQILKNIHEKELKSCLSLQEQLKMLKKKQEEEQEEINVLQNQLLVLQQQSQQRSNMFTEEPESRVKKKFIKCEPQESINVTRKSLAHFKTKVNESDKQISFKTLIKIDPNLSVEHLESEITT